MLYPNGEEVALGDRVSLGKQDYGVVICDIDNDRYSSDDIKLQWSYLGNGVMIDFENFGLIHMIEPDPDLLLISRDRESPA